MEQYGQFIVVENYSEDEKAKLVKGLTEGLEDYFKTNNIEIDNKEVFKEVIVKNLSVEEAWVFYKIRLNKPAHTVGVKITV